MNDNNEFAGFNFRQRGLFFRYPYTMIYKGPMTEYVFYTDMKSNGAAGEHQLTAKITKLTNAPVDDSEIVDAFIESVSKKILTDVLFDKKEYIECLKTLPKGFYTEKNVEHIIENVTAYSREKSKTFKNEMQKQAFEIDVEIAFCDLRDYAHSQNSHVRKGTGRDHIGE